MDFFSLIHSFIHCNVSGAQYYMALSGFVGEQGDTAKMKLLLSDRAQQGSFCLSFDYRMLGQNVGTLKVLLDNNSYPVWEQSQSRHQSWQTEFFTVAWKEEAPQAVSHVIVLQDIKGNNTVNKGCIKAKQRFFSMILNLFTSDYRKHQCNY